MNSLFACHLKRLRGFCLVFRFEQLCINFANEALQQFFVQSVFVTETREYMKQGLSGWQTVPFKDNQENIDIILRRPVGLLSFLDQQVLLGDRYAILV